MIGAATAVGAVQEQIVVASGDSNGLLGDASNSVQVEALNGGYSLGRIDLTGTLTSQTPTTWRTDARIRLSAPGGQFLDIQPFTTGTTFGSLPIAISVYLEPGMDPGGNWTVRLYEAFDDGGAAVVDAQWNLTLSFTDEPPTPPAATELGILQSPGASLSGVNLQAGQVRWFTFETRCTARSGGGTFLDIFTVGSVIAGGDGTLPNDTEIGLYDAGGNLIATDDDSGDGSTSLMSFGVGVRAPAPPTGSGLAFSGQNGVLPRGRYYIAVGTHDLQCGPSLWNAVPQGTQFGAIAISVQTNIIDPCAATCAGDADGSGTVNFADVTDVLTFWLSDYGISTGPGDANGDGVVNFEDITEILSAWLTACD